MKSSLLLRVLWPRWKAASSTGVRAGPPDAVLSELLLLCSTVSLCESKRQVETPYEKLAGISFA
jgi:hypothetical protein